jgi:hypothetical protein
MINMDLVKQYADARKKLMDAGVISSFLCDGELHVRAIALVNEEKAIITQRPDGSYPYEISVTANGIKIFGLLSEEDFKKYFPGYMVEDVQLDGMKGEIA